MPAALTGAAQTSPNVDPLGLPRDKLDALGCACACTDATLADKLLKAFHRQGETEFARVPALAAASRTRLSARAAVVPPRVVRTRTSADGTRKWLLQFADGAKAETVFIPHERRGTLCVSSQVGCALNCAFCATARGGFGRNLGAAEIVAQLWLATHRLLEAPARVTNVVFMGMGEPMLNLDAVVDAMRVMTDDCAYALAPRHVTVSTAGHVAGMRKLGARMPVNLSVSLHAPDDALRDRLVPLNRRYPLAQLLAACREYAARANGFVTFQYTLLDGENASRAHALALADLLKDTPCKINLLAFNDFPNSGFRAPSAAVVDAFYRELADAGYVATLRRPRGADITAACGQLAAQSA